MRILLVTYCILAIAVCITGCVWLARVQAREQARLNGLQSQLEGIARSADDAQLDMNSLELQQRQNRASYTPQQAVEMSVTVQDAQAKYDGLLAQVRAAQSTASSSEQLVKRRQVWYVPIIGFGLLHFLGIFYFISPERKSSRRRRQD